jgi:chromosome partitioning protein
MRRIAIINQKGGVGKTTTSANLGAALAEQGRRVVVVDMDPQANASLHLGIEAASHEPSVYSVLTGDKSFADCMLPTKAPRLSVVPSNIDLSGAELELASAIGRDSLIRDAIEDWCKQHQAEHGEDPADYVIFDCPPSLGLLSINALAAAGEVLITLQTQFLALMGMSKLVEVVQLIRRRLNPELTITGIVPCLYDSRLKLNREVLGEVRKYFPGQVFKNAIRSNVKLAEAPSFGISILDYASESNGAQDYRNLALEVIEQESRDTTLTHLPPARSITELARERTAQQAAAREQEFAGRDAASATAPTDGPKAAETQAAAQAPAPEPKPQEPAAHVEAPETETAEIEPEPADSTSKANVERPAAENTTEAVATPEVADTPAAQPETPSPDRAADTEGEPELREHVMQPSAPPRAETKTPDAPAEPRAVAAPHSAEPRAVETQGKAEPPATPPVASVVKRSGAVEDELRILRADDLPQLPPEAFELPR